MEEDPDESLYGSSKPMIRPMTAKVDGKSLTELKTIAENLDKKLEDRRTDLNPLLQELRPLREQFQVHKITCDKWDG